MAHPRAFYIPIHTAVVLPYVWGTRGCWWWFVGSADRFAMAHLNRDKTAVKMGHPALYIPMSQGRDMGHPGFMYGVPGFLGGSGGGGCGGGWGWEGGFCGLGHAGEVEVLLHGLAGLLGVMGADGAVDFAVHLG